MSRLDAVLSGAGLLSAWKPAGCLSRPGNGDRNEALVDVDSPHTGAATRSSPLVRPGPTQSGEKRLAWAAPTMSIQKLGSTSRYTTLALPPWQDECAVVTAVA